MHGTDLDNQAEMPEPGSVRLPWESIDPEPFERIHARASAATRAVEARGTELFDETGGAGELRDEWLAAHAFFSDEIEGPQPESISHGMAGLSGDVASVGDLSESTTAEGDEIPAHARLAEPIESADHESAVDAQALSTDDQAAASDQISAIVGALIAHRESLSSHHSTDPVPAVTKSIAEQEEFIDPFGPAHDRAVTFATVRSLETAADELAGMAESFGPTETEIDEPGNVVAQVSITVPEGVFVIDTPDVAAQPEPEADLCELAMDDEPSPAGTTTGGGWTIPLMCVGIGLIACCAVIPQGEANRRLRYEQSLLQSNLQHVEKQVAVNNEFLKNVSDDPTLAERLAGRQMKTIRRGQKVVELGANTDGNDMSPFALVAVPQPPKAAEYRPVRGTIADLCNNARARLYLMGIALTMVAVGLVMGFNAKGSDS